MKQYKMATIPSPSIIKQPIKLLEIPLNKFSEEVIPHHQRNFDQHKTYIRKLIAAKNIELLAKETKDKKRSVKQLRDLLYELDTLRTQVEDNDLDAFDIRTMPLRTSILKLTKAYQGLEKTAETVIAESRPSPESPPDERVNPFEGAPQLLIQANLDDLQLQQAEERLNSLEELQQKTEDLKDIHEGLHHMSKDQAEQVTEVEVNVECAQENVQTGFRNVVKAHKLSAVAYPATGAFVGSLLGGPIGFLAGLKVGGLAAIGCAVAGYAGGRFLKHKKDIDINDSEHVINNENNENHTTVSENAKKEI